MICHVVLYKMKPGTNAADEDRLVEEARTKLPLVGGVMNLRAGRSLEGREKGYSVALAMDFQNEAALDAYRVNSGHQRFVKEIAGPLVDEILRFDFSW